MTTWRELACARCDAPMKVQPATSALVCETCGARRTHLDVTVNSVFAHETEHVLHYKRINHFNEKLLLAQGRENTVVPEPIIYRVMLVLEHNAVGTARPADITNADVREALRALGHRAYYANQTQIRHLITGIKPPALSPSSEHRLRVRFGLLQGPYWRHFPAGKKPFIHYPHLLYKLCELEGLYEMRDAFQLHKGADKRAELDAIWRGVCEELDGTTGPTMPWPYIPTSAAAAAVAAAYGPAHKMTLPPGLAAASGAASPSSPSLPEEEEDDGEEEEGEGE